MRRTIAVISDLHVGEGVLDDFDAELEGHLETFLHWLGTERRPAELVVNGDFLDFAQATPWRGSQLESFAADGTALCFTEEQSLQKFRAIRDAHAKTFAALNRFLCADSDNCLVVLPGNHDADFFWPSVRAAFLAACAPGELAAHVEIPLSRAYQPDGAPWLWIEHGHQFDRVNSFFVGTEERWSAAAPPIMTDADGVLRLYECIGTRFLVRFINGLDARYPLVDNVKPFSRFLRIFGASALRWGRGPVDAVVALAKMTGYLARTLASRSGDLLTVAGDADTGANPLANWYEHAAPAEREKLRATLKDAGFRLQLGLEMALDRPEDAETIIEFLATHLDVAATVGDTDAGVLGASAGTLALGAGFLGDETRDLRHGAQEIVAREGVSTVIMGHTHESVADFGAYTYFNTGSWTRYYVFDEHEKTAPWRFLREASYERFPYRLRYALVQPGADSATLDTWRERSKS